MTVQTQHRQPSWQSSLKFLASNSDPAMALKAPEFMIDTFKKFQPPPDIDLEGGTLLSVEESEEIDPTDNCKVQVTRYHILSADGTEESTITKRRKLKVNCTQSLKRLEFCNGKEVKFEEKAEILTGDVDGFQPKQLQHRSSQFALDHTSSQDQAINDVLMRTQDTFMTLLHQKKDAFLKMFPDLFANMRTQPAIFDAPSTTTETIVNPDGTTVTRMKSSKQFSSHYTRHETYVNGVKQESKCKFRAFMEYQGPEGGFSIRLNDNPEADLSEDENENDDFDVTSKISRSVSEIPDTMSAMVSHGGKVPKLAPVSAKTKKWDKAWHSVNELVESENRYVQKLALLDKFRARVEDQKLLDKRQIAFLFANIESLYRFHNLHLLPQLMDRQREWQSTKRISDVMRKQAPFLKMYSEYTNNYKRSTQIFEECLKKKKGFEEIVRDVEKQPECENLPLISHLICPVQRVMRYQLLLKEYLKHLEKHDIDYSDTEAALELVLEAASHANEMMRKLDRYKNVLEVQEQLGNSISLVSPTRELLTKSKIMKISSGTNKVEERVLFVFNDLFLLVSERSIGLGGKYKLRAIFDAYFTQICEGDNLEREHSFYLRGADGQSGPLRCVELFCASQSEKKELIDIIWSVISESHARKNSFTSSASSNSITSQHAAKKACSKCDTDFSWYTRGYSCIRCNQRYCKKCFGPRKYEHKKHRVCAECVRIQETISGTNEEFKARQDLLAVPAKSGDLMKASHVEFKGSSGKSMKRYFVLRKNFCLYSYENEQDDSALAMLPISGCEIDQVSEKWSFTIKHMNRTYLIKVYNETDHAEWIAVLVLSANASLPTEGSKMRKTSSRTMQNGNSLKKSNTLTLPGQRTLV